jgi:hypothetical protein
VELSGSAGIEEKHGRYAVGAIRKTQIRNALDDFPTPPWATRALCEYVIEPSGTVLEPATGRGYMSRPLAEYFASVTESDIDSYGRDIPVIDFVKPDSHRTATFDLGHHQSAIQSRGALHRPRQRSRSRRFGDAVPHVDSGRRETVHRNLSG